MDADETGATTAYLKGAYLQVKPMARARIELATPRFSVRNGNVKAGRARVRPTTEPLQIRSLGCSTIRRRFPGFAGS